MSRSWANVVVAPLCVLLAGSGLARADGPPPPEAKKAFSDGKAAYDRGDYEKALELFQRAALIAPAPSLYYNIGMAYERLGRYEDSARAFDKYLQQIDPPQNDGERNFQDNLRARATADHARGRRPSQEAPPVPLVEPPQQQMPQQRPGYAPYPYYGYGYGGYGYPPAVPQLTKVQRMDNARRHRNNGIILTSVGLVFFGLGVGVTSYGGSIAVHDSTLDQRVGVYFAGISALAISITLLTPGALAWARWQKTLDAEKKLPDDGAVQQRAAIDIGAPPKPMSGGIDQYVMSTPAFHF